MDGGVHIGAASAGAEQVQPEAYALLRTITSYTLGTAFNEVAWGGGDPVCQPDVRDVLRPDTPDDLAQVADTFCGQYDYESHFQLGLDLMLRGAAEHAGLHMERQGR